MMYKYEVILEQISALLNRLKLEKMPYMSYCVYLGKFSREGGHMKANIAERVVICKIGREGGHLQKYGRDICKNTAERVLI